MSASPVTRKAVGVFDHPGLFLVPLDRPRAISAAAKTPESPAMRPGRARVAPTDRPKGGLRRCCSGCARETEHVPWAAEGREHSLDPLADHRSGDWHHGLPELWPVACC